VIFYLGTDFGGSDTSRELLLQLLGWVAPEWTRALTADQIALLNAVSRKAAHVVEYAVLAGLTARALAWRGGGAPLSVAGWAVGISLLVAGADEFRQSYTAERTPAVGDVAWDLLGACLGAGIQRLIASRSARRRGHRQRRSPSASPRE
jgi:VanZ family protein